MSTHETPADVAATGSDPLAALDAEARSTLASIADHLIPAAHGMPSARDVVDDARLRFVLGTRPDLVEPLVAALRDELGADPSIRLHQLEQQEPADHAALTFVIVAGYYTDADVRERIGYPGQQRIVPDPRAREPWDEEGLTAEVLARGPVYKDPVTGQRAARKEPS